MLVDACHSGEVDKDEIQIVAHETAIEEDIVFKSFNPDGKRYTMGLNNSFELMRSLFADLRRGTGTQVISSSSGVEFSLEGKDWKNGVFTYDLKEALINRAADANNDGVVMVGELMDYVSRRVTELTNGAQTPTMRSENLEFDFSVR